MAKIFKTRTKTYLAGGLFFFALIAMMTGRSDGYILPSEQVLQFMGDNFAEIETITLTRSVYPGGKGDSDGTPALKERIWVKVPDLFRSELIDPVESGPTLRETRFWRLLIANNKAQLQGLLSAMGIDLQRVALTRFDGSIAYRIGGPAPDEPKVIIEKARFIPLLISYRSSISFSDQLVTIQFKSHRKLNEGWFPYEILDLSPDGVQERYLIESLRLNARIKSSFFRPSDDPNTQGPSQKSPEPGTGTGEEVRMNRILNAFEEKYR